MLTLVSHDVPKCLFALGSSISCQAQGLQRKQSYCLLQRLGVLREEEVWAPT